MAVLFVSANRSSVIGGHPLIDWCKILLSEAGNRLKSARERFCGWTTIGHGHMIRCQLVGNGVLQNSVELVYYCWSLHPSMPRKVVRR
jgi:hypothetical protein